MTYNWIMFFCEIFLGRIINLCIFADPNGKVAFITLKFGSTSDDDKQAKVAQLVEHNLAKVGVASSNLVFRSECLPS